MGCERSGLVNEKVPEATHATGEVTEWLLGNCFSISSLPRKSAEQTRALVNISPAVFAPALFCLPLQAAIIWTREHGSHVKFVEEEPAD